VLRSLAHFLGIHGMVFAGNATNLHADLWYWSIPPERMEELLNCVVFILSRSRQAATGPSTKVRTLSYFRMDIG
jgi:hypothetical protein